MRPAQPRLTYFSLSGPILRRQRTSMVLRIKLGLCGIKLSTRDSSKLDRNERAALLALPYQSGQALTVLGLCASLLAVITAEEL